MEVDLQQIEARRESSRRTAAQVHTAISVFYFLIIALMIVMGILASGDKQIDVVFIVALIFSIPALVHFFAAKGLREKKGWARPLSIVIGILLLFGFPIGTICGVIILYQLLGKQWDNWEAISEQESKTG